MTMSSFRPLRLNDAIWVFSATIVLSVGCGGDSSGKSNGGGGTGTGGHTGASASGTGGNRPAEEGGVAPGSGASGGVATDGATTGGALTGACPNGFDPQAGTNMGFSSDGKDREFHLDLPDDTATPRPLFVALTGTVQEEVAFTQQAGLDKLTASGWIVAAPVRTCSQDGIDCSTYPPPEKDGRIWEPWFDGTTPATDDPGPDVRFVESMVHCIATKWPVDQQRIYVGGISAGGSFTNRNMSFNSALFAGGVVSSGNWYGGQVTPKTPPTMSPSIVIVNWGGPNDTWPPSPPYAGETKSASEFYAAQPNVATVSCSGTLGHQWPAPMTSWFIQTLLSYPKGSDPQSLTLTTPPAGFTCVLGAYTDH
jgi:poly(3-hydroxybutyrate) depolymerase